MLVIAEESSGWHDDVRENVNEVYCWHWMLLASGCENRRQIRVILFPLYNLRLSHNLFGTLALVREHR